MKKMKAKFMPNASVYVEQKVNEINFSFGLQKIA